MRIHRWLGVFLGGAWCLLGDYWGLEGTTGIRGSRCVAAQVTGDRLTRDRTTRDRTTREAEQEPASIAVIRPKGFAPALREWEQERTRQGFHFYMLDSDLDPHALRSRLQQIAMQDPRLQYVLLAADAPAIHLPVLPGMEESTVPTFYQEVKVLSKFGPDKNVATDLPYSDLNGDGIPELAIGRVPVDTVGQLQQYLRRVLAYEDGIDLGLWRKDIQLVAGVGGFGAVVDTTIEMITRRFLTDGIPDAYAIHFLYASPTSVYCPSPERFCDRTLEGMNRGSAIWIYVGHGHIETLDQFHVGQKAYRIFDKGLLKDVAIQKGSPIAVFLACYTGAFDAPNDSLAEQLLQLPAGPVATIAGSRVTMPYGMSCLGWELLQGCFRDHTTRIGDLMLLAKQRALLDEPANEASRANRKLLDQLAILLNPQNEDLKQERAEHLALIHLLGDPTMTLNHPKPMELEVPKLVEPGSEIEVVGRCPVDCAEVLVQLAYRRDQLPEGIQGRTSYVDSPESKEEMDRTFEAVSQGVLQQAQVEVEKGSFRWKTRVPNSSRTRMVVQAYGFAGDQWAAGSMPVITTRPRPSVPPK